MRLEIVKDKTNCALCCTSFSLSNESFSNILKHYKIFLAALHRNITKAESPSDKRVILEKSLPVTGLSQNCFGSEDICSSTINASVTKKLQKRVTGILFVATRKIAVDILCSDELAAFIDCASGVIDIDKSKAPYLSILVYATWCVRCSVKCFIVIYCISKNWIIHLQWVELKDDWYDWCCDRSLNWQSMEHEELTYPVLSTLDLDKYADEHESIIRSALKSNDRIGSDVLIFPGTSKN